MTANEDPAEATGAERPADALEDWLSDLRTEVAADPPGWIDEDPDTDHPADRSADRPSDRPAAPGPGVSAPSGGGRHRAPE